MQSSNEKKKHMELACKIPFFRDNRLLLNYIATLDTWQQQYAIIQYTHSDKIPFEKMQKIREAIVEQPTWQGMYQIARMIHIDDLIDDEVLFNYIKSQRNWQAQEQLITTLAIKEIREDNDLFSLIKKQGTWDRIKAMREAILNKKIAQFDKLKRLLILEKISNQDDVNKQKQLTYAYEDESINQNEEALASIEMQDTALKMDEVRLAYKGEEIDNIDLVLEQPTEKHMYEVRLTCEDRYINKSIRLLKYIASLLSYIDQEKARIYFRNKLIELYNKTGSYNYQEKEVLKAINDFDIQKIKRPICGAIAVEG